MENMVRALVVLHCHTSSVSPHEILIGEDRELAFPSFVDRFISLQAGALVVLSHLGIPVIARVNGMPVQMSNIHAKTRSEIFQE
jgi:hypothetical protein